MATIKHIFKGESLSMLFTFPAEYDMARIQSHGIWIGRMEFTGVIIGQGIELKLTSLQTDLMSGNQRVSLWIDDSQLGVRKPYIGDLTVGNTNALPDNESTSEVYDVIVNVDISVTSIEAGDLMFNYVKGDPFTYDDFTPEQIEALKVKGDAFAYSDFTPEQITLLQKPASDIATTVSNAEGLRVTAETNRNNAEGLRLSAETTRGENEADRIEAEGLRTGAETGRQTAEALRVTAEQARQTNTATAIQNAETATQNANTAAKNVVDGKSVELQTTATHIQWRMVGDVNWNNLIALSAITGTNGKEVELQTAGGYIQWRLTGGTWANLVEINSLISEKENTANKQNSLTPDGTGTKFPTVDAVNAGLVASSNLLYQYVHSGNKEVYISSIDYSTNTFTSVNHGLVNGDRLGLKIISDGIIENVIPFTNAIPQNTSTTGYYVINSAGDTFQISATSGGAAITTINKATQDFSKWRFEVLIAQHILLPNIPSIGCEIEVIGDIMQLNRYVNENSYPALSTGYYQLNVISTALVHDNTYLLKGWYRISIRKTGTSMFVNRKYVGIQLDTTNSARIKWVTAEIIMLTNGDISLIDNILLTSVMLTNGTIINVYKI